MDYQLQYKTQAENWEMGLPIGNGRLAAMVVSAQQEDRLALNHESIWRGTEKDRQVVPAAQHLPEIRKLLQEGKFFEATALSNLWLGGGGGISGIPSRVMAYLPAGDFICRFLEECSFQQRSLNIITGVSETHRICGDAMVTSQAVVSCVDGKMGYQMQSQKPICAALTLSRAIDEEATVTWRYEHNTIRLQCSMEGIWFEIAALVKTDGNVQQKEKELLITDAKMMEVTLDIAVNQPILTLEQEAFSDVLERHISTFRGMMEAVSFHIAGQPPQ